MTLRASAPILVLLLLQAPAVAEEQRRALVLGAPPASWRARPAEPTPYAHDFDLPTDGAEPARVSLLLEAAGLDDHRARLASRWLRADGAPVTTEDQVVEPATAGALRLTVVDQAGTYQPPEGPARPGWRLVAAHLQAEHGTWSAWLLGPAREVQVHREAYLTWLRTAREADAPADEAAGCGGPCGGACGMASRPGGPSLDARTVHGAPPHGIPNPWTVVGQRIGEDALRRLGSSRDDGWQLVVTLRSPAAALPALDGLLVATGASPGKGNLLREEAAGTVTVVVAHRPSGRVLTYQVAPAVLARLGPVASSEFPRATGAMLAVRVEELFSATESRSGAP